MPDIESSFFSFSGCAVCEATGLADFAVFVEFDGECSFGGEEEGGRGCCVGTYFVGHTPDGDVSVDAALFVG